MPLRWGSKSPQAVLDDWTKQYPQLAIDEYDIVKILGYVWALRSGKINENQYDPGNWHISPGCGPWSPAEPANPWAGTGWKAGKDGSHANQHLQGRCGKATMDIKPPGTERWDPPWLTFFLLRWIWNMHGWSFLGNITHMDGPEKIGFLGLPFSDQRRRGLRAVRSFDVLRLQGRFSMKVGRWQKMSNKMGSGFPYKVGPSDVFALYPPCILLSSLMSTLD